MSVSKLKRGSFQQKGTHVDSTTLQVHEGVADCEDACRCAIVVGPYVLLLTDGVVGYRSRHGEVVLSIGQRTGHRLCLGTWQVEEGQVPGRPLFIVPRGLAVVGATILSFGRKASKVSEDRREGHRAQGQQHLAQLAAFTRLRVPRAGLGIFRR